MSVSHQYDYSDTLTPTTSKRHIDPILRPILSSQRNMDDQRRLDCRQDQRALRSKSSGPGVILFSDNGRLIRTSTASLNSPNRNGTYSNNVTSRNTSGGLNASALHASALKSQNHHHPQERSIQVSDRSRGSPRGSPQLIQLDNRNYVEVRRQPRLRHPPQVIKPQVSVATVSGSGNRNVPVSVISGGGPGIGNGGGGGGMPGGGVIGGGGGINGGGIGPSNNNNNINSNNNGRSKSAVVSRVSGGVSVRELTSSSGVGGGGNVAGGAPRGQIGTIGNSHIDSSSVPSLPPAGPLRYGASVSSLPAVLSSQKLQQELLDNPPQGRKYVTANGSVPRAILTNALVDARNRSNILTANARKKSHIRQNTLTRPLIKNSQSDNNRKDNSPSKGRREQPSGPPPPSTAKPPATASGPPPPQGREDDYQKQPIHTIALWSNIPQQPIKDPPPIKSNMVGGGGGCCANCCTRIRTASCGSLLMLPLHILLLFILIGYLALGAFIFSRLEGNILEEQHTSSQPSTIRLPGTPKSEDILDANKEMVERVLNTSMEMVMEKSIDSVFNAILTSAKLQHALRVFETFRGDELPSDKQLDLLSDNVVTEWQLRLYNITARYYALVTRHAYGYKVGPLERAAAWNDEEPPITASWSLWPSLLHAFCLITTMGGSIQAVTSGGRATTVVYSLVGVVIYVGVVTVWAARLATILALIIKLFSRKKVENSSSNKMMGPHYEQSQQYTQPHRLSQLHQTPAGLFLSIFILLVFILSAGVQVVGGRDYGLGLENVLLVLATVRPPIPLPEGSSEIMGFIGFVTVGHILMALLISISWTLSGRWWTNGATNS